MDSDKIISKGNVSDVVLQIRSVLDLARSNVAREVNNELLNTYWNIGRIICEYEQSVPERADYGKQTLKELARELTQEFGKGKSLQYEVVLSDLRKNPDGVWKIELVALLRTAVYF